MMWAVMGIGMLINTIQGAKMRKQVQQRGAGVQQQMNRLKSEMERTAKSLQGSTSSFKPRSISKGPDLSIHVEYPQQAHQNLKQLQSKNLKEQLGLESQLKQDFSRVKEQFFKENHYHTEFGSKGKGRVLTDASGKPQVKPGAETPQHNQIRRHYESAQRLSLADRHGAQMNELIKQEAGKTRQLLGDNQALLTDAGFQQELQKMIVNGKKKALKLQQDQDDERWQTSMPPTPEIQAVVQSGLQDLRLMEQRHMESELQSADHQILLDFDKEFAGKMADERARLAAERATDKFLMNPRMLMMQARNGPPKPRFDEVLPGYLTTSLFQMGIYEV